MTGDTRPVRLDGGQVYRTEAERVAAQERVTAALALHPRFVASNTCVECEAEYPCPTVRALTGGAS